MDHHMQALVKRVKDFIVSEDGPTATEYAVMLALIIVVAMGAITAIGNNISSTFNTVSGNFNSFTTSGG